MDTETQTATISLLEEDYYRYTETGIIHDFPFTVRCSCSHSNPCFIQVARHNLGRERKRYSLGLAKRKWYVRCHSCGLKCYLLKGQIPQSVQQLTKMN